MQIQLIYFLPLLLTYPLGIILAKITKHEKQLYTKYFKFIIPILALATLLSTIYHLLSTIYHLLSTIYSLTFTFITTIVWQNS